MRVAPPEHSLPVITRVAEHILENPAKKPDHKAHLTLDTLQVRFCTLLVGRATWADLFLEGEGREEGLGQQGVQVGGQQPPPLHTPHTAALHHGRKTNDKQTMTRKYMQPALVGTKRRMATPFYSNFPRGLSKMVGDSAIVQSEWKVNQHGCVVPVVGDTFQIWTAYGGA
jgi:hypothetical protein